MSKTTQNKTAQDLADQLREDAPLATTETTPDKSNGSAPEASSGPIDKAQVDRQLREASAPRRRTGTKVSKASQLVAGADERVHIWYVGETGKEEWCDEYSLSEVQRSSSIEGFIRKYLVPKYGYGEFVPRVGKPGMPREKLAELPSIYIRQPKDDATPTKETSTIRELMEMTKQVQQEGKTVDPVESLERMLSLQERLNGGKGDASSALLMMMMMDQKKNQGGAIDPLVMKLVDRLEQLERRVSKRTESPPQQMMPPPPPPPDPMEGFSKMLAAFAEMQKSMAPPPPPPPPQNSRQEFLQELHMMRELFGADKKEEMGFRDYIALVREIRELDSSNKPPGSSGPRTLEDQLAEYRKMRSVFGEMSQEFGGSTGGFWDFARDFLSGSPVGQKLGDALEEAIGSKERKPPDNTRQLPAPDEDDEDEDALTIPPSFTPFAKKMDEMAEIGDKATLIRTTLESLQHLAKESQDFRPYVMKTIHMARTNKKRECLKLLGEILLGIHEAGVIKNVETVKAIIFGVREHWLTVCKALGMEHESDPDPYIPHTENRASASVPAVGADERKAPAKDEEQEEEPELEDEEGEVELTEEDYRKYVEAAAGSDALESPDASPEPAPEPAEAKEDLPEEEEPQSDPETEPEETEPEPTGEVEDDEQAEDDEGTTVQVREEQPSSV